MSAQPSWLSLLISQVWTIPYIVVYIIGILLALIRWYHHPQVSLLALLGFVILLFTALFNVGLNVWLMAAQDGITQIHLSRLLGIAGVIRSLFSVVAYGLLMAAIFGWRQTTAVPYHGKPEF